MRQLIRNTAPFLTNAGSSFVIARSEFLKCQISSDVKINNLEQLKNSFQIEELVFSDRVDREVSNFDVQSLKDTADLRDGCT